MRLARTHSDFRHPGLSRVDFKTLEMDRVLTAFLARLRWDGRSSRLARRADVQVEQFVEELLDLESKGQGFAGFAAVPDISARWVGTHLVDMVHRGRPTQRVAGLRPLHGFTYRYRNSRHSRPYGADEQLYEMLASASNKGASSLGELRDFFFPGLDRATGEVALVGQIDVETQALIHLCEAPSAPNDRADGNPRQIHPPFCASHVEQMADDTLRLLHHQGSIPRSVLVDYLKILFAFHLALHHMRLVRGLPVMLAGSGRHRCRPAASTGIPERSGPDCEFLPTLFVDVANRPGTPTARLSERSAAVWWQRFPRYIRAAYEVKKLDELGSYLETRRVIPHARGPRSVEEAIALGRGAYRSQRDAFFTQRLANLLDSVEESELPEEVPPLLDLKLDDRTTYLEILAAVKGKFHRGYLTDCLDSLLLKGQPGAAIAQPRRQARRFVLDSALLEVLLQISLMRPDGATFRTHELRVDELLTILRVRYGLHIDRLPDDLGSVGIDERAALRANARAFTERLREIGYYSELSDAYLTQTIRPRYTV